MNVYILGTKLALFGDFSDVDGVAADPTTVVAKIRQPDGVVVEATATKISTGHYEADFTPTQEGLHGYRFEGTGECTAAGEKTFMTQSAF